MITDPAKARRAVLVSVFALLAIAAYRGKLTGSGADVPFARRLWGVGVVAIILGITADFAPQVAGPFAVLLVVGSLTKGGDQAIQNILGKASGGGASGGQPVGGATQTIGGATTTFGTATTTSGVQPGVSAS